MHRLKHLSPRSVSFRDNTQIFSRTCSFPAAYLHGPRAKKRSVSTTFHVICEQQGVGLSSLVTAAEVSDIIAIGQCDLTAAVDHELPSPSFNRSVSGDGTGQLIEAAVGRGLEAIAQCKYVLNLAWRQRPRCTCGFEHVARFPGVTCSGNADVQCGVIQRGRESVAAREQATHKQKMRYTGRGLRWIILGQYFLAVGIAVTI